MFPHHNYFEKNSDRKEVPERVIFLIELVLS